MGKGRGGGGEEVETGWWAALVSQMSISLCGTEQACSRGKKLANENSCGYLPTSNHIVLRKHKLGGMDKIVSRLRSEG